MVLDPIPQSLPVHFFGSRPQPPTSPRDVCRGIKHSDSDYDEAELSLQIHTQKSITRAYIHTNIHTYKYIHKTNYTCIHTYKHTHIQRLQSTQADRVYLKRNSRFKHIHEMNYKCILTYIHTHRTAAEHWGRSWLLRSATLAQDWSPRGDQARTHFCEIARGRRMVLWYDKFDELTP